MEDLLCLLATVRTLKWSIYFQPTDTQGSAGGGGVLRAIPSNIRGNAESNTAGFSYGIRHMFSLWFSEIWDTVHWITMKTCRIPNENTDADSGTGGIFIRDTAYFHCDSIRPFYKARAPVRLTQERPKCALHHGKMSTNKCRARDEITHEHVSNDLKMWIKRLHTEIHNIMTIYIHYKSIYFKIITCIILGLVNSNVFACNQQCL